jgi:hypothetical protein
MLFVILEGGYHAGWTLHIRFFINSPVKKHLSLLIEGIDLGFKRR